MLSDIANEVTSRVRESREYLELLRSAIPDPPAATPPGGTAAKGLFFVSLYAVIEFTVYAAVQRVLQQINVAAPTYVDLKPLFLSMALDSECRSVADSAASRSWPRRRELFRKSFSSDVVIVDDSVMPTDGSNIKYAQLSSIWDSFCISDPVLPDISMRGRLEEVTEHRNAIAHGRESAATVGARYTFAELEQRLHDVDRCCSYILQVFDAYLQRQQFRR